MTQTSLTGKKTADTKKLECIAEAVRWVVEHPDAPIDPLVKEFVKIVMGGVKKDDLENPEKDEEAEVKG